ncbi:iron complex outermembrane recepter protein [Nitrosospira sp. Nl5]|uniref:TonB-dependent receptor family protein n=1 Tax=Nitrosospira sp. Nl5 TaxID=200120 RepID=UPI0008907735|nr:TonB-dependent receptor [Nitrosospira sp. Nl5]SCY11910.1 iron complex outermembrane recepter protein [Nitrosospira sp. Nl5]
MKESKVTENPVPDAGCRVVGLVTLVFASGFSSAQSTASSGSPPSALNPVVVTGTRVEQSSFSLPMSIDVVEAADIQEGRPRVNLSESLVRVPGLVIQNRQNYAQDLQVSSRGFGARSTFGIRGIRLIVDDIPATMPDGQGQAANINLGSTKRIEVLRGPFSAIYGNASGGVIQAFTEDGPPGTVLSGTLLGGSYGTIRGEMTLGGTLGGTAGPGGAGIGGTPGPFNYVVDISRFETQGFREHSAATRYQSSAKLTYRFNQDATLTLVTNHLHQGDTLDPLGLTRVQASADPSQADERATTFNTRKSIDNSQGGLVYEHRFSAANTVKLIGYMGTREILQFLAVPRGAQTSATSSGGVVDLDREFGGLGLRWTYRSSGPRPLTVTSGIDYDGSRERRKGFENFVGTALGVRGGLRRNENNTVTSFAQYVQTEWEFSPAWALSAGLRHTEVNFRSEDFFIRAGNANDSGSITYRNVNPVMGLLYKATPALNLYISTGSGFETPTFSELGYKPDGTAGLNFALKPSKSLNVEAGIKWLPANNTRVNLALFESRVTGEIVPATSSGGRTTFQNASDTRRRGVELSVYSRFRSDLSTYLSYAYLDATFQDAFSSNRGTAAAVTVAAGNFLPGVPRNTAYGELVWRRGLPGFSAAVEAIYRDKIFANDTNTEAARHYAIANIRLSYSHQVKAWKFTEFVRVDNLTDTKYIGSVIVNEGNSRFYEPAPGRNYMVGVSASYTF